MAFAQIYICPEHGETIYPELVETIDTENDEVYRDFACPTCYRLVTKKMHDGKPVLRPLTDEELFWETWSNDDEE